SQCHGCRAQTIPKLTVRTKLDLRILADSFDRLRGDSIPGKSGGARHVNRPRSVWRDPASTSRRRRHARATGRDWRSPPRRRRRGCVSRGMAPAGRRHAGPVHRRLSAGQRRAPRISPEPRQGHRGLRLLREQQQRAARLEGGGLPAWAEAGARSLPAVGRPALAADATSDVRGLGLQFNLPDGELWRTAMVNVPRFPFRTPEAFYEQLLASKPDPATGKPDP